MKYLVTALVLVLAFGVLLLIDLVQANYQFQNSIGSYWNLSDKASTLQQKSAYLDQYVAALEQPGQFSENDATIFPTPNNSFAQNMVAVRSLQDRMHQIRNMDEQSFAYQTAMQQITGQEQGEAQTLTDTFEGCWYLRNHPLLWGWHGGLLLLGFILALVIICTAMATT